MKSYKLTTLALMLSIGIAGAAYAQDTMPAPKDSMAKPAMGDSMAKPAMGDSMASKDSMGMKPHKKMAMKSGAMKHDAMKGDAMKSDSTKSDSMAH
jgi:pentapeptide MXKDX repeat protein